MFPTQHRPKPHTAFLFLALAFVAAVLEPLARPLVPDGANVRVPCFAFAAVVRAGAFFV